MDVYGDRFLVSDFCLTQYANSQARSFPSLYTSHEKSHTGNPVGREASVRVLAPFPSVLNGLMGVR